VNRRLLLAATIWFFVNCRLLQMGIATAGNSLKATARCGDSIDKELTLPL
jgi:hypothetical protein